MNSATSHGERQVLRRAIPVIAGVTLIQIMATMGVMLSPVVAPQLARTLGVDPALIGLQISLAYIGAMTMSPVAGVFVRRLGGIRTSQLAALGVAAGCTLIAAAGLPGLAAGSLVLGTAYGLTNPAASHLLMRVTNPATRNLVFSIKQTGQPLGGVVAGLMAPSIAVAYGWPAALYTGAALAACTALAIEPLRVTFDADRDTAARLRENPFEDLRLIARHHNLALLAGATLCFSSVQLSLMGFTVTMLVEELGFALVPAGSVLALVQIAGVSGRLLCGVAADRTGDGNLILAAIAGIAALSGLATSNLEAGAALPAVLGVLFIFGFSAIGWTGVFMAEIARLAPGGRVSGATGAILAPAFLGVILGPMIFTLLHRLTGAYTGAFAVMAVISLAGSAFMLAARRLERRERDGRPQSS